VGIRGEFGGPTTSNTRPVRVCKFHSPGSGLSPLVIDDVVGEGERIVVRARTPGETAVCPVCGVPSERVHSYHWRTVTDVPVTGLRVVIRVRYGDWCSTRGCHHAYREQTPGVLDRYQRRTTRLQSASRMRTG
jgi:transposase